MQTTSPPPPPAAAAAAAILVLLLSPAAVSIVSAQMTGGSGEENPNKYQPTTITPSMAIIIVVLIFAVFFMGIFSIYVRHCSDDGGLPSSTAGISAAVGAALRSRRDNQRGLPTDLLLSFPTFPYHQIKSLLFNKPALECAVCLFEFQDDEKLKLLPNCNHVFHCECIDPWLSAHSTCPLCRSLLLLSDHPPPPSSSSVAHGAAQLNTTTPSHLPIEELQASSARPARLRLTRSHSTGHSLGRPPESRDRFRSPESQDRFTLRVPEEVRERLLNRGANRVWQREGSSRRGYRGGEGSWRRYRRLDRPERGTKSDRWLLTAAPPFFSRVAAATSESGRKTPVMVAGGEGGGLGGSGFLARPPV